MLSPRASQRARGSSGLSRAGRPRFCLVDTSLFQNRSKSPPQIPYSKFGHPGLPPGGGPKHLDGGNENDAGSNKCEEELMGKFKHL